jgi:polyhydroxyalkanoate synthesis regulator phasin
MSEDWKYEDQAEKLAETANEVVAKYLSEHGTISRKDLIELLMEKCELSRDEAEKFLEDNIEKGKLRYDKKKRGYVWCSAKSEIPRIPRLTKHSQKFPHRRARARLDSVLKLPPDPHTLPCKSHFLAKDWHPYYHPAMDKDKLGYLKARKKMGAGADWPA